jgi:hypothetical protein
VDSRRGVIAEFLALHPGGFCIDCVALALDIPARHLSMARHRLTATGVLSSDYGRCSGCNKVRPVVAAAGIPAERSVSQAAVDAAALPRVGLRSE